MSAYIEAIRQGRWVHPNARRRRFWLAVGSTALLVGASVGYFRANFLIGFSAEAEQSVGSAWTLVRIAPAAVNVGDYAVFNTDRRVKLFPPGTHFVKLIVAGPGDVVVVSANATTVNGKVVAGPLDSAAKLHIPVQTIERTVLLGAGEYFAVGTRPHSYDSRYWGPVSASQFVGPARLL